MGKKKELHNAAGKKIVHPADAERRKHKKRKLEKMKKDRMQSFESKLLDKSPEDIELEIRALKHDQERKAAAKIDITKAQRDRLTRLETGYKRLKEKVDEKHQSRMAAPKSSLHVDFEELKIHRKASIFYHPVMNPYGAPPTGQTIMYKHPDGSVRREPPAATEEEIAAAKASDEEEDLTSSGGESEDDDGVEPALPSELPGGPQASQASNPGLPPLPVGLPPLPPGPPPGRPKFGAPPGPCFGGLPVSAGPAGSQADFLAELRQAGFELPGASRWPAASLGFHAGDASAS